MFKTFVYISKGKNIFISLFSLIIYNYNINDTFSEKNYDINLICQYREEDLICYGCFTGGKQTLLFLTAYPVYI